MGRRFDALKLVGEWSKKYANLPDRYVRRAMRQVDTRLTSLFLFKKRIFSNIQ